MAVAVASIHGAVRFIGPTFNPRQGGVAEKEAPLTNTHDQARAAAGG